MGNALRAVVVGINTYADVRYREQSTLRFARADAEAIADTLHKSKAFTVEHLDLLTDQRATSTEVRRSLETTFSEPGSGRNTIALFYFAGHGQPQKELVSLCCHDVDWTNLHQGGIRLNDIYYHLQTSTATYNMVIIDACFSGGIIDPKHLDYRLPAERAKLAIETMRGGLEGKTIAFLAACRADQPSRESKKLGHGFYTHELLQGWQGEASDADGVVRLVGLINHLSRRFAEDRQIPRFSMLVERPLSLWIGQPPAPAQPEPISQLAHQESPLISTSDLIKLSTIGTGIPTAPPKQPAKVSSRVRLAVALASMVALLAACGLATAFVPFLRVTFFAATCLWGVGLIGAGLVRLRWLIVPFALAQLALLVGFASAHFGWGTTLAPLTWLASFEPLLWVLLILETVIAGVMILYRS